MIVVTREALLKGRNLKLIVDSMLGDLAKWLRILGVDTEYDPSFEDSQILATSFKKGYLIVTRDRELFEKARALGLPAVLADASLEELIAFFAKVFGVELRVVPDRSRCPKCNGRLIRRSKEELRDKLPPKVYERVEHVWQCEKCGHVYWVGSHMRNMLAFLSRVAELVEKVRYRVE